MPSYASLAEFYQLGLKQEVVSTIPGADVEAAQFAARAVCDSRLAQRYTLPLVSYDADLKLAECKIAAWEVMCSQVGFNPTAPENETHLQRYEQALQWLDMVAEYKLTPTIVDSSSSEATQPTPQAFSDEPRGWSRKPYAEF